MCGVVPICVRFFSPARESWVIGAVGTCMTGGVDAPEGTRTSEAVKYKY